MRGPTLWLFRDVTQKQWLALYLLLILSSLLVLVHIFAVSTKAEIPVGVIRAVATEAMLRETVCKSPGSTIRAVRYLFHTTVKLLKKNNITYWIDDGTLLGSARFKTIIPWDNDAEITILHSDYPKLLLLREDFQRKQVYMHVRELSTGEAYFVTLRPVRRAFKFNKERLLFSNDLLGHLDVQVYYPPSSIPAFVSSLEEGKSPCLLNSQSAFFHKGNNMQLGARLESWGPKHWWRSATQCSVLLVQHDLLFPLTLCEFDGVEVNCPRQTSKYLSLVYGESALTQPVLPDLKLNVVPLKFAGHVRLQLCNHTT